jgi:hypothetical protein
MVPFVFTVMDIFFVVNNKTFFMKAEYAALFPDEIAVYATMRVTFEMKR